MHLTYIAWKIWVNTKTSFTFINTCVTFSHQGGWLYECFLPSCNLLVHIYPPNPDKKTTLMHADMKHIHASYIWMNQIYMHVYDSVRKRRIPREIPVPSDPTTSSSLEAFLLFHFELKIFGIIDCNKRIV